MLAVLGAIDAGHSTLVQIAAATGLANKSVIFLLAQAGTQAGVVIAKRGPVYSIEAWGPVLKREGARKALTGALYAPIMER